jgi:hypothetical protein
LHVHEAEVRARIRNDARERRIAAQRGHVVDQLGPQRERRRGHRRLRRVDRDGQPGERGEHWLDAAQLLVRRDTLGARPRRLAADVDDRGALVEHPPRGRDSRRRLEMNAAVGERVRRDVEHAHHGRPREALLDRVTHRSRFSA